jgi:hypothetical protein
MKSVSRRIGRLEDRLADGQIDADIAEYQSAFTVPPENPEISIIWLEAFSPGKRWVTTVNCLPDHLNGAVPHPGEGFVGRGGG